MNFTKILLLLAIGLFLIGFSNILDSQETTSEEIKHKREMNAKTAPNPSQESNPEGGKPNPYYSNEGFKSLNEGTKICEKDDPKCKTTTKDPKLSAFSNEFSNEQTEFLLGGMNSEKGFHLCCYTNKSFVPTEKESALFTINISGEKLVHCYINSVESNSESVEEWRNKDLRLP